jgi:glyoxylate/hydroxypyruvate reductase A
VTVTPHNAAVSEANAISAYIAEQIRRFESGAPLENVVRPELGY